MDNLKKITPRYQYLAIPRVKIDTTDKVEPFKVKRGALSYRITDSLNRLALSKKSFLPENRINHVNPGASNVARNNNRATRKKPNLDKYAEMIAINNKQCPSRIKQLATPKKCISEYDHFA